MGMADDNGYGGWWMTLVMADDTRYGGWRMTLGMADGG